MARTQHLPLYSAVFVFVREIYKIRVKLPKILKHDLGQEVFQSALKILKCVVLANRAHDKSRSARVARSSPPPIKPEKPVGTYIHVII